MEVKPGQIYTHFKNPDHRYRVLHLAKDSETMEDLVVYEALYDEAVSKIWVRPLAMFIEHIDRGDYHGPRFKLAVD
jgi:hypothetical protein